MTATDPTDLPLAEASRLIRDRAASPVELTQACLARIERLDPVLNAFITVTGESALERASAAEREIGRGGWLGPLHGIPIALKDLLDTAGVRTTAASGVFEDRVPERDAHVTARLRDAGAVLIGKLNMHELAYGGSSVVGRFGPVRNVWSSALTAGGSSSGSAVAVAARLCYGAVGTDTGGSIRQPAAFAGIVGLKPTYGLVSSRGVIPLSTYNDHVGPMTRTVLDAALMLQAMAGYDAEDVTSIDVAVPDYAAALGATEHLRIGVPRAHFWETMDAAVMVALDRALVVLEEITALQREVAVPAYMDNTVFRAEIYAYHREMVARMPERYQADTLRRIITGADVDAPAYIAKRREMDQLRRSARRVFEAVDLLVMPTSPVPPFETTGPARTFDELRGAELATLRNTRPFNALGWPAISVPCGFTAAGLPIGMQIVGPPGGDAAALALAHGYQQRTDWHRRRPPLD
jgi:aspartyl-tRNA(Asn)/glutamyl-tRNA(Gln) amidotransferase subunit A